MTEKTNHLMKQCFDHWNTLKRCQTLEDLERDKVTTSNHKEHELLKYKTMAKLELGLRGLQAEMRRATDDS